MLHRFTERMSRHSRVVALEHVANVVDDGDTMRVILANGSWFVITNPEDSQFFLDALDRYHRHKLFNQRTADSFMSLYSRFLRGQLGVKTANEVDVEAAKGGA